MTLSELIQNLRLDLGDQSGSLFDEAQLERSLRRGLVQINGELDTSYQLVDSSVSPTMTATASELLLLLAQINACVMMRSKTANSFSFSSGDKRVDKTKQPEHWAKLAADLTTEYKLRLKQLKPDIGAGSDDYIIRPTGLYTILYEQGVDCDLDDCD